MFYERNEAGEPSLVFVHGFACSHEDWKLQVDFFRSRYSSVALDLRGHGASDGVSEHCTIEMLGADLTALLKALHLGPVVLIGHSLGCRVVLQAYLSAPESVVGLVLVDGSYVALGDPAATECAAAKMLRAVGYTAMLHRLFNDMFVQGSDPVLKERVLNRALLLPEKIGSSLLQQVVAWDARVMEHALAQITVPVLILQSTQLNTAYVRVSLQTGESTPWLDMTQRHVPRARIKILEGVGHFSMLEAPTMVNAAIEAFLREQIVASP